MQPPSRRGFSVRVFLPGGDPDGIKVVEKSNWTGCGLVVPRALFGEAKARSELERAGVYVLVGQAEVSPLPQVYVGEGDPVRPRLEQHAKQKDFWTHAVVFTSKDQNLNKAHVQRLEARLVELARASKRCVLDNNNVPQPPSLSESDTAEVEGFLADVLLCLPILGYGFFESTPTLAPKAVPLFLRAKGIEARGFESPKGFIVRAGSKAVKEGKEAPSIHAYLKETRAELVRQGVLIDRGAVYELAQDYTFSSPSMASGVLLGRSSNGRVEWQTADGRTLKNVQDAA
ncbi:MAG TPA: GIY-YIG nuclease family protein [Thermoanaerobaculia bacterium]|nr:GIY-YIG nuclease family protein [Thermoanaerobaculia bacterium]